MMMTQEQAFLKSRKQLQAINAYLETASARSFISGWALVKF